MMRAAQVRIHIHTPLPPSNTPPLTHPQRVVTHTSIKVRTCATYGTGAISCLAFEAVGTEDNPYKSSRASLHVFCDVLRGMSWIRPRCEVGHLVPLQAQRRVTKRGRGQWQCLPPGVPLYREIFSGGNGIRVRGGPLDLSVFKR